MISRMMCTVQVTLSNNEGVTVLELDPVQAVFPLSLSFNFCVVTPLVLAPHPGLNSDGNYSWLCSAAVFRIHRIHMFLGHPDPLIKGMDPDPDPSIIKQKM